MKFYHNRGRHSEKLTEYFAPELLDAFYTEDVLTALYGDRWHSVLIVDGDKGFHHTFVPSEIAGTGYFDIEPFIGYSGPVTVNADKEFLVSAFAQYTDFCCEQRVVAELIRFNPHMKNHLMLEGVSDAMRIVEGKQLVYVPLHKDDEEQLKVYSKYCRKAVRRGYREYNAKEFALTSPQWDVFPLMYSGAMKKLESEPCWLFDADFFNRLRNCKNIRFFGVYKKDESDSDLVVASVVISGRDVSYHFITANIDSESEVRANKVMIHTIASAMAQRGVSYLCLGGGHSDSPDDPLLYYKQRFSYNTKFLPLGFVTHNEKVLSEFVESSIEEDKTVKEKKMFLKYRLAKSYDRGRMTVADLLM
ncbi:MAG: hypothetical protein H8D23_13720 [Candidatus Brocadiales bacterium]|nr:hypothetical protein [Candidatus Brocadiales bacterium]